jgi:ATP-binding cassette subfamily B protein
VGKISTGSSLRPSSNGVELNKINFSYPETHSKILNDVSISINPGEFFTITGRSGSGKSTLVKIVSGILQPDSGEVLLGNANSALLSQYVLNEFCYFVTQNEKVFMDTVRFNLQIANPSASEDELLRALHLANFTATCVPTDNSILDTILGDEGMTLSGGQRQRLSLARLFLRAPSIIILDEITSSLDVINEFQIMQNIRSCFRNATIINISHRISTFQHAQRICVLEAGSIVEVGTLASLKETSEYISDILNEQN